MYVASKIRNQHINHGALLPRSPYGVSDYKRGWRLAKCKNHPGFNSLLCGKVVGGFQVISRTSTLIKSFHGPWIF